MGWLLVSLSIFWGVRRFCYKQLDGFEVGKISSHIAFDPRWEIPQPAPGKELFARPFTYLGKGAQCYVFASQDQEHVIKFFRVSHIQAPEWFTALPLPAFLKEWREKKVAVKESKREKDFLSYKLAYEKLKEETGLTYLHLNKSSDLHQKIQIIDKIGISHTLDLDQMEFIIQKRAKPLYPAMEEMIEKKKFDEAKASISHLIQLLAKRHAAGLADKDPDLKTNFGLVGSEAIQFDIGRFKIGKSAQKEDPFQNEVVRITDEFKSWLKGRAPTLAEHLEAEIEGI